MGTTMHRHRHKHKHIIRMNQTTLMMTFHDFANFDNFKQIGSSGNVLTKNGNKELFLVIV